MLMVLTEPLHLVSVLSETVENFYIDFWCVNEVKLFFTFGLCAVDFCCNGQFFFV